MHRQRIIYNLCWVLYSALVKVLRSVHLIKIQRWLIKITNKSQNSFERKSYFNFIAKPRSKAAGKNHTPQEHISSWILSSLSALCSYITVCLAVDMTVLEESSAVPKNEVHTSFNIAIFEILFSTVKVHSVLHKNSMRRYVWLQCICMFINCEYLLP